MRLLVLTNLYPPHSLGGYELLCAEHVAWLRGRGHEVTVVTSTFGTDPDLSSTEVGPAGETVVRCLDFHATASLELRVPSVATMWQSERRQRQEIDRVIRQLRPEAALVWGLAAISKALLQVLHDAGVGVVAVLGEHWPMWDIQADVWVAFWSRFGWFPVGAKLRRWAGRTFAPTDITPVLADLLPLYVSEDLRIGIEACQPQWQGRGRVVPNAIDQEVFKRDRDLEEPLHQPLRLLYAGRIEPRKGPATAVEALPLLQKAGIEPRLTLVGWCDPAYRDRLDALAANLGVRSCLRWREPVPRHTMADVYREHDILLFPTVWAEPFGLVALEAMASGCIVVATGTGGSGEFLHDGESALLFAPGDPDGLAQRVGELSDSPDLVAHLRDHGARTVARNSFAQFAATLEAAASEVRSAEPRNR